MFQHDLSSHTEGSAGPSTSAYLGETLKPRRITDSSAFSQISPCHRYSPRRTKSEPVRGNIFLSVTERSDNLAPSNSGGIRQWEFLQQPPYEPSSLDLLQGQEYQLEAHSPDSPQNQIITQSPTELFSQPTHELPDFLEDLLVSINEFRSAQTVLPHLQQHQQQQVPTQLISSTELEDSLTSIQLPSSSAEKDMVGAH